jgi:anti-sigma regulatory factor (Ser/Thr protein kinase)
VAGRGKGRQARYRIRREQQCRKNPVDDEVKALAMTADHDGFRGYYVRSEGPEGTERVLRLALPPDVPAVRLARRATRDALAAWQLADLEEDAVLLVSELVTNAIRHAVDTGAIGLELTSADTWLRLEVQDGDPHWRQMEDLDDCGESGYGFVLVDSLADRWGVRRICAGKAVWAELDAS